MYKNILFYLVATFAVTPNGWALDVSTSCNNPEGLSAPISFYSSQVSAYFAATDTCMREAFQALGMLEKTKPNGEHFMNEFFSGVGFDESTTVYSEKLNMIGDVGQFNADGKLLIDGLGFKVLGPDAEVQGTKRDDALRWRFRVCNMGTEEAPDLKSCLLLAERWRIQF